VERVVLNALAKNRAWQPNRCPRRLLRHRLQEDYN